MRDLFKGIDQGCGIGCGIVGCLLALFIGLPITCVLIGAGALVGTTPAEIGANAPSPKSTEGAVADSPTMQGLQDYAALPRWRFTLKGGMGQKATVNVEHVREGRIESVTVKKGDYLTSDWIVRTVSDRPLSIEISSLVDASTLVLRTGETIAVK